MATLPSVEELYACYDLLSNVDTPQDKKECAFVAILSGTKGDDKQKRLASQFIARFFKDFKDHQETSFSCLIDLCDDVDCNIRKQTVHDLQQICKYEPSFIPRVSNVFTQMLMTNDNSELAMVTLSLTQLLHLETRPTIEGIFGQLFSEEGERMRGTLLKFLGDKLKNLSEDQLTVETEELIVEHICKLTDQTTENEFINLICILASLKSMSSVLGRQKLVNLISKQVVRLCPDFDLNNSLSVKTISSLGNKVLSLLSKNVHAGDFLDFLLDVVLPRLDKASPTLISDRLVLLRLIAQLSEHPRAFVAAMTTGLTPEALSTVPQVAFNSDLATCRLAHTYKLLENSLPNLPDNPVLETKGDLIEDKLSLSSSTEARLSASVDISMDQQSLADLECLVYLVRQLGRLAPHYLGGLTTIEEADDALAAAAKLTTGVVEGTARLAALRPRLQLVVRMARTCASQLDKLSTATERTQSQKAEIRMATNVQQLILGLFRNPPSFRPPTLTLSWLSTSTVAIGDGKTMSTLTNGSLVDATKNGVGKLSKRPDQPRYRPGPYSQQSTQSRNGGGRGGLGNRLGAYGRRW